MHVISDTLLWFHKRDIHWCFSTTAPWYNRSGWLGVKHKLTYLLTLNHSCASTIKQWVKSVVFVCHSSVAYVTWHTFRWIPRQTHSGDCRDHVSYAHPDPELHHKCVALHIQNTVQSNAMQHKARQHTSRLTEVAAKVASRATWTLATTASRMRMVERPGSSFRGSRSLLATKGSTAICKHRHIHTLDNKEQNQRTQILSACYRNYFGQPSPSTSQSRFIQLSMGTCQSCS